MSNVIGPTVSQAVVRPDPDTTQGANQRFRLHVPTANTTLLLGKRKADDQQDIPADVSSKIGYTGVDVITVEHIYVSSAQQTVTVQSEQRTLIQAIASPLTVISKNLAFLGSTSQVLVAGKAGVALYGGKGPTPVRVADFTDAEIPVNPKLPEMARIHDAPKAGLDEVATPVCDEIETDADALEATAGAMRLGETVAKGIEASTATTAAADEELVADITHAYSRGAKNAGLALHGEGHVSISSDADLQALALANLGIVAKGSVSVLSTDRSELSSKTVAFVGGGVSATVMGGDEVLVVSKAESVLAAREGTTKVLAPKIEVGLLADAGAQKHTRSLVASAETKLLLDCEDTLTVDGKTKVLMTSTEKVEIVVGSYVIELSTSQIVIKGPAPQITVATDSIELKMGGSAVKLEATAVKSSWGGSSVECAAAGTTIKGPQIKLG